MCFISILSCYFQGACSARLGGGGGNKQIYIPTFKNQHCKWDFKKNFYWCFLFFWLYLYFVLFFFLLLLHPCNLVTDRSNDIWIPVFRFIRVCTIQCCYFMGICVVVSGSYQLFVIYFNVNEGETCDWWNVMTSFMTSSMTSSSLNPKFPWHVI